jgi:hypothetical protein
MTLNEMEKSCDLWADDGNFSKCGNWFVCPERDEEFDDYCLIYYTTPSGYQYGTHLSNVRLVHPVNGAVYPLCKPSTQD